MQIVCILLQTDNHASTSLPAALRAAQACRHLIYSEADFEILGRQVVPMGVKFGMEGPSSMPNFTPIGATTRV